MINFQKVFMIMIDKSVENIAKSLNNTCITKFLNLEKRNYGKKF